MKQHPKHLLKFWAGWLAAGLMITITGAWAFWGAAELYYEAWGLPFPEPLYYLIPGAITLALTLLALKWPRAGGWFIILLGAAFTWFVLRRRIGQMGVADFLSWFPLTFLTLAVGALFVWGGREAFHSQTAPDSRPWWRRHLHYLLAVGIPALIIIGVSAWMLPRNLMRVDDGDRSARLIRGNGVALVWAPAGPGWNWRQPYGGYPSWDMLAWYGRPPVGMKIGDALPPGHAIQADVGLEEYFHVQPFGEDNPVKINRQELAYIIEARVEEIFSLMLQEIKRSGYDGLLPAGMVLTGGVSALPGIRKLASRVLGIPVKVAQPEGLTGMVDQIGSPAYATSVGLLRWATLMGELSTAYRPGRAAKPGGKDTLEKAKNWLKRLLP